ncbi:malectin domain-containing carbohydrate-binding protein [Nocardioides aequoreus]|uniref:malectin domain-containing carbohydrate-binding protein n=1 Tax=Nocardioides aequoreus TaxID=397278 RepID=UPI00056406F8|nr:malectin domain-containing carbohydrate-binding protein [Nocardioides aequoreus]
MNAPVADSRPTPTIKRALLVALSLVLAVATLTFEAAAPVQAVPPPTAVSARIDFAPAGGAAAGWTLDSGAAYSEATGMGWVREDSLSGAHTPLALTLNTRTRSCATGTAQARSFIHMQAPVTNATNDATKGAWEYAVPAGQYRVEVGYGDANSGGDAESHTLNAEGVNLVRSDVASFGVNCVNSRMRKAVGWATVTDGKLTLDAVGGTNTKLAYVAIDSVAVSGLEAEATTDAVTLNWDDIDGASGYRVWRSETLPASNGQAPLTLVGSPTTSELTDTSAEKGVLYSYSVAPNTMQDAAGGAVVRALADDVTPQRPSLPLKVDFKDRGGATASGYVGDFGQGYSNTRGFGWVSPGTDTPVSLVGNGRTRTGGTTADVLKSSMMHLQYPATGANQTNGTHQQGAWQAAVANGRYDVQLTVGDREPGQDPTRHVIHVEDVDAFADLTPAGYYQTVTGANPGVALTGDARFRTVTLSDVRVTDGFLTIDAIGGTNTKLTDLTVTSSARPDAPTGLTATAGDGEVTLDWADNAESGLQGYHVYRGTTANVATTGTPLTGETPVSASTFVDNTVTNETTYHYVVVAVGAGGERSGASTAVSATPDVAEANELDVPFRLNFTDAATTPAAGFLKDHGQAFTNTRGYGWVKPGTHETLNLVGNGRLRPVRNGVDVDIRQRGLMHMQGQDVTPPFDGIPTEGAWEAAVADGTYEVTVSVGDRPGANSVYDSQHSIVVEGEPAIEAFQATAADEFETATVIVTVDDGRLTVDAGDGTNTKINFIDVEVADSDSPAAPSGLEAEAGDEENVLSWSANTEPDLAGYRVYGAKGDTVTTTAANRLSPATPQAARTFTHDGLTNGDTWSYVVTAVDAKGNESVASATVSAKPGDSTPPAPVTALEATAGDALVELTWTASTSDDVATYFVYRGTSADITMTTPLAEVDHPTATYTDTTVTNGTEYFYRVVAVDESDNGSAENATVSATPADTTAPSQPTNPNAAPGDGKVTLTWGTGQNLDIASFKIFRGSTAGVDTDGEPLATVELEQGANPTYVDDDVTNGETFYYRIVSVDRAGNESEPSVEVSTTPVADADTTPPPVPAGVTATAGDARVTVRWTATDPAIFDLRGYRVYRSAAAGQPGALISGDAPVSATELVDTTALNGTAYHYTVTAVDTTGNESARSSEVSATPVDTTAPAAPTGVTATAGVNRITVTWDAAPEGSDVARYRIYRARTANFPLGLEQFGTFRADQPRTFIDANVIVGTDYTYVVTALDAATPPNESPASQSANATALPTPDTTPPAAPTQLQAEVEDDDVTLTWTASTSGDVAGYEVYRADTAGGTPTKISSGTLTATTFVDADRPRGTTGYYTVRALDTSSNASSPSNSVTATVEADGIELAYAFQPDSAPVLTGFTKDIGSAFSLATGRGWVTQASLASQTHTPLNLTANTRLRTRTTVSAEQNRVIHMQYGDIVPTPTTNGDLTPGAWEHVVDNGRYEVEVSAGDQPGAAKTGCAAPCYDSLHVVRAEGVSVLPAFQATAATEYKTGTAVVDVTDGRLTLDAIGGNNTKINWVKITSAGPLAPDTTAPGAATGLLASAGSTTVSLSWSAPSDTDVAGYHVYRAAGSTVVPSAATRISTSLVTGTSFADSGLANGTQYSYAVQAVDNAGNVGPASGVASATPSAGATDVTLKVDFGTATTTPASGYLLDYGQAFGARTGANQGTGLSFGWVSPDTSTPVSLVGNGRNRNTESPSANEPDARRATTMHMQYVGTAAGSVTASGSWEVAVPNGLYSVKVDVGDAGTAVDSNNWVNIENQNAVAAFTPGSGTKYATATRTVAVTDGRITLSPVGGTNTKITYVDIASVAQAGRPYSEVVLPLNGATDVVTNVSPTASNQLPGGAVSPTAVVNGVRLTRVSDGAPVAGVGATSGGGDTVSFRPDEALLPSTLYRFDVLETAADTAGNKFLPFSSVFTTRADSTNPGTVAAAFDRSESGATKGKAYTSLAFGPDGKLYASTIFGQIYRYDVAADGTLTNAFEINTVRNHATAAGWEGAPNRTVIGMAFDPASTPTNPILWITDNYAYLGSDVPNGTGAISRLTGANLQNYQEVVINLPRSIKDHETNSLAFHNGKLYTPQGSMNAMGATDGTWKRPENLLSAAVLELDPAKLPANLPVDASTPEMEKAPSSTRPHARSYNPYAANAPLTLYATGIRNAYDLVWHSNGNLYVGTNGSAAGGNTPAVPTTLPASCANRPDGGYTGPSAPALTNNRQDETDYMFNVKKGKYYGHPNPERCEYILNAGNPTGYTGNPLFKVNAYPAGQQADPNYDLANVYDAGMHASANGTIEYQNAGAFGGALKGKLVVVRYSANQELVTFDVRANGSLSGATTGIAGFTGFAQPLDVAEDPTTGNLYVAELPNNFANTAIKLLKPRGGVTAGRAEATSRLVFTEVQGGAASAAQNVVVRNTGTAPLTITGATVSGPDAGLFARTGTLPTSAVPAGGTATIPVTFNPTVAGPRGATLTVTTDSQATPSVTTTLRGLGTLGTGGSNEPSLQWILDTLQIPVDVGDPDPTNNDMPVTSALIGDEVEIESFRSDPFDNIVRFEALSLFGPAGPNGNTVTVGAYDPESPTDRTTVGQGPNGQNQKVLPIFTGTAAAGSPVDNLPDAFSLDFTWHGLSNRVTSQQDERNLSWSSGNGHKVRVYPLKNADGTVEPYSYIVAPEDVPTGVDFQDAVMVVRNVQPLVTSGNGDISASKPELVFSGVKGTTSATQSVEVTNDGTTALEISSVALTGAHAGDFTLAGGGPATLPVGGTATYQVAFKPGASTVGVRDAVLRVTSDDADTPQLDLGLHGLSLNGLEGGNEPPLADVVKTLGRNINVGWSGLTNDNPATGSQMEGDEVLAPLFTKAGTGEVSIKPVARFSPDEQLPFGWYLPTGSTPELSEVAKIDTGQHQTLNPAIAAGGASSFDPAGASFGLYVDSKTFNRKSYTQSALNTGVAHAVRTYPAKDRAGTLIPNTYLVGFEDATNGDYQDYVFEISNVRIAGSTGGTTPVAKIDFGPATSSLAAGYTRDSGAAFTTGGSGWVNQATGAPQSMVAMTRDRAGANLNQSTLVLMQPTAAQLPAGPAGWRYTLPNGTYQVTVGVGDPDFFDSVHRINVEGQTVVPNFAATTAARSTTGSATVQVTDGVLDLDAVGGTNTKIQYVDIERPLTGTDTTAPVVSTEVTGLQTAAGTYKDEATVRVSASDPESSIAITSISIDNAPFTTYTAPVKVTEPGTHTVRARAQNGAGLFTTTAFTTFRVVTGGAARGDISVSNQDGVPFDDRLVMNRIQTISTTSPNVVHDVSTLRISNTGPDGLNVTGLDVTGPFAVVDAPTLPALVPAGGSLDVKVRFTAQTIGTNGGLWTGTLDVKSDDVDEPSVPVELAGFWQSVSEGNQEPDLIEITRLFGYGTQIVSPGQPLNQQGLIKANGDEILSPYWLRANTAAPVTVRQLAAYHTQGNTASFFWHAKGSTSTSTALTHVGEDGQSILPRKNDANRTVGQSTFTPAGAFGLKIDPEWSDPVRNDRQLDVTNGCPSVEQCGHHLRVWPAKDRSGAVIANTYLVAMDYAGINYDYNDNVYLVSNIKPETAADPGAQAPVPGASSLQLEFDSAVAGTLVDVNNEGTGFRSTQPNERDVAPGSDSYQPLLLDLVTGEGGSLRVTSSGTATEGTNGGNDNTLVNGLRLPFDGTGDPFSVTARIAGPVTQYNAGSEQAGIQLGNDQDNYVKASVIQKTVGGTTGPAVEFYAEQAGTGVTVGTPVLLPNPASVTSVDLALLADPGARTVRAAYRTNGGAWTILPTAFTAPATFAGKLFDARSHAGILVSHKGGDPLVARYESFGIVGGNATGGAPATREALLRIDTGSSTTYTDTAGNVWAPDTGRFTPTTAPAEGNRADAIAGTTDDPLYATYRGNTGSVTPRNLTYSLPTRAATKVDLRLHFAERAAANNTAGKRLFDIDVEGETVRRNVDIFAAAGGLNTATVLGLTNVTVKGGSLELALKATADYPAISAIEVLCQGACPVDSTPPAAPTGLTADGTQAGVTLDWTDSTATDLVGYRVYRSATADGSFTELTTTPLVSSTYVDTTAPANTAVFYRVVAIDTSDNVSAPSSVVSGTRPVPVQQPVRINTGGTAQTVGGTTWSACSSATACSGWVSGGFAYSEADTNTALPAGTNNAIFQSEWTGGATGTGTVAVGARAFGFAVPVQNGQYQVRLHFAELNKTAANTRTFDVRLENATVLSNFDIWTQAGGINRAVVRQFPVTVTDGSMTIDFIRRIENAKISAIEILPGTDTTAPAAPASLTATAATTGVSLTWPAVVGDDIAGYHVYRATSADGEFTKLNDAAVGATTYPDTTAPAGVRSYYRVRTVDTAGNLSAPVAADALRPAQPPAQVTGLQATGSQSGIALGWTASNAAGLTGYHVYRATTAGGTYTRLTTSPVATASYDDATAPAGAASFYQVTAVNAAGEGPRSATASATRPAALPAAVTGLQATGSQSGIALGWTASNATGLTGYHVYRATTAGRRPRSPRRRSPGCRPPARRAASPWAGRRPTPPASPATTSTAPPPRAPGTTQPVVRINAGGGAITAGGVAWSACSATGTACANRVTGGFAHSEADTITGVPAGMSNAIFQSEWTGGQNGPGAVAVGARAFGFAVPVQNGQYQVRLHFAELNKTAANTRTFDVRLENATVLSNFDIWTQAGGIDRAIVRQFPATVTDGSMTIDFVRRIENAKVSAIEIIPVDTVAPGVVTGVGATGATSGNTVSWATNPAADLVGYHVYRATSAGGSYTRLTTNPVAATSYADATAATGAASYYQVTAVDASGNESARSATVNATRPATARPTIRINAGGPAVTAGGVAWSACSATGTACSSRVTGGFAYSEADTITGVPAGMSNAIFQSEWTGGQNGPGVVPVGQRAFGFAVPVTNGRYQVRLHFAELNKTAANQRTFDVRLENATVLSNFDIWAQAGGIDRAIVRQFDTTVTDGSMTIDFIRRIENAKVSAIEIIPVD